VLALQVYKFQAKHLALPPHNQEIIKMKSGTGNIPPPLVLKMLSNHSYLKNF